MAQPFAILAGADYGVPVEVICDTFCDCLAADDAVVGMDLAWNIVALDV